MVMLITLAVSLVFLILFQIFDYIEIKKNKYRSRTFFIVYHIAALFFSGLVYVLAMILGTLCFDTKEYISLVVYWALATFALFSFVPYAGRLAYCIPKKK